MHSCFIICNSVFVNQRSLVVDSSSSLKCGIGRTRMLGAKATFLRDRFKDLATNMFKSTMSATCCICVSEARGGMMLDQMRKVRIVRKYTVLVFDSPIEP